MCGVWREEMGEPSAGERVAERYLPEGGEEGRTAGPGLCAGPDGLWKCWERGRQVRGQQGVKVRRL